MSIQLTPQQQQAIDAQGRALPRIIDPRSNLAYVLIPETEYENIRAILEEERDRQVIHETALRNAAGRMEEDP